jgi:hypothetical protein
MTRRLRRPSRKDLDELTAEARSREAMNHWSSGVTLTH